jgi:hypothetical protein
MTVAQRLGRLGMIGLQENRIALGKVDHQNVDLPPDAAQHRPRLAEIRLSVTRRVRQRDEDLLQQKPTRPDVVPHRRVAAVKTTLVPQPFEQAQDRMPLLLRLRQVGLQNLVDKTGMRVQLRPDTRFPLPVSRRD